MGNIEEQAEQNSDIKICCRCKVEKNKNTDFYKSNHSKSGIGSYCKKCSDEIASEFRKSKRAKERALRQAAGEHIGRGKAKSYQVLNEEEKLVFLEQQQQNIKDYQKQYHHDRNKGITEANKQAKLENILAEYGSTEAYEEFKRLRQVASCKAAKKAAEQEANVLKVFDCLIDLQDTSQA